MLPHAPPVAIHVEFLAEGARTNITKYHPRQVYFFDYSAMSASQHARKFAEFLANKQHNVDQLLDLKIDKNIALVLVRWSSGDVSWEPLSNIYETCPLLVQDLIESLTESKPDICNTIRSRLDARKGAKPKRPKSPPPPGENSKRTRAGSKNSS